MSGPSSPDAPAPHRSRLTDLIALAQEPAGEKRRILLRELTDHFFGAPRRDPAETALYGEVLASLCAEMETTVRAELSSRFAAAGHAPPVLIRRLSLDADIAVAGPVLAASPVLTDADLLKVAGDRDQGHLRAVSRRAQLSEPVSDVIVRRSDDETLEMLLANDGARLSRQASEAAVRRAQANPALHDATVSRRDLPPDLLNEMYFAVEARLRRRILDQNARLDPALLDSALAAGRAQLASEDGVLPPDYDRSLAYVEELKAAGQLTPNELSRLLRSNSRTAFFIALAQLADMDFHTIRRILERRELDALAVVCKAADLDRALFLTYAVALLNDDGDAMGKANAYARLYAELPREAALRTLRFWRVRRTAQAA